VNTYQQHIINKSSSQGTQRTQDVCIIFHFITDFNSGVFQQQLNIVQLYKSTNSLMQDSSYILRTKWYEAKILNIYQSAIGTGHVGSASCICMHPTSSTTCMYTRPSNTTTRVYASKQYCSLRIPSELLGFVLQNQLKSSATNLSFSYVCHWSSGNHNTSKLSNILLLLHNKSIWILLNHA